MTKAQLIKKVSEETGLAKKDVRKMLDKTLSLIATAVRKGDGLVIANFGRFTKSKRKARTVKNPKTGKVMKIAARFYPRFQSSKQLKDVVDRVISWDGN